jgi:1-acyl-sn-glycerol-3-phosphate acyltransferase
VPFANGESFFGNFLRLLGNPSVRAEVHFCPPVALSEDGRRRTAEASRAAIVKALGLAE